MQRADLSLEAALDATYEALRAGRIDALSELTAQTESLFAELDGTADRATLLRIQQKSARNSACLEAARRGVKSAKRRLGEVTAAHESLGTYDRDGRRDSLPETTGQLRKRF